MSLSDCIKCWDSPCTCGWEYRDWSIKALTNHVKTFALIIAFKRQNPNAIFSNGFNQTETDDDKRLMEFIKCD
jgi:hypothetical protein